MIAALRDTDEPVFTTTPHLSHSRIGKYLHCPEQYRLYYIENLRPLLPAASLVFGKVLHQALAYLFNRKGDPAQFFLDTWNEIREVDLSYSEKESWEKFQVSGQALIEKFCKEHLHRLGQIRKVEKPFELKISTLDLPFVGVIDLFAEVDTKNTVVDFKTSGSAYQDHEAILSDQLTAYQLAEPQAEQAALCVLVKTKEPKIEWFFTQRSGVQLLEYLSKADYVAHEIASQRFYKRPGKWCSYCDYLPVCSGDKKAAEETLVQIK